MKTGIVVAAALMGLVTSSLALADWSTTTQDDIFSGGKKAMMFGTISPAQAIAFDCDSEQLTLALLQKEKWSDTRTSTGWDLLVKVDKGEIHRFKALSAQRNDVYVQYITGEKDEILKLLADLRNAKTPILLGLQSAEFDSKWSGTVPATGSTRETDKFLLLEACKGFPNYVSTRYSSHGLKRTELMALAMRSQFVAAEAVRCFSDRNLASKIDDGINPPRPTP